MRLPWQTEKPAQGDDPDTQWDDVDPEPEGTEPEVPTLDVFDDEARGVAEAYTAHAVEQARAAERSQIEAMQKAARDAGFAVNPDGSFGLADPSRAEQWFAPLVRNQQQAQQPTPNTQAAAPEPPPDPEPDAYEDPAGYARWHARAAAREFSAPLQAEVQRLRTENEQLTGFLMGREQSESANRLQAAVSRFNPLLEPILQHPDFQQTYQQYIGTLPREQLSLLSDPQALAGVVGAVATYLDPARLPQAQPPAAEPPRDQQGRYTRQQMLADVQRASAGVAGSSRDAGPVSNTTREVPFTREDQIALRQIAPFAGGLPRDVWAALEEDQNGVAPDVNQFNAARARTRARR
jgi:hypothetical protein